jgi:hypothetical protein
MMTSLKQLISTSKALLQPPAPLPSSPPELLDRLRQSSALVPWRNKPGWTEDDELEQIGDDDKPKQRRDELVLVVGLRCLDIIEAMQEFLSKEFWPVDERGGLDAKDCTFVPGCEVRSRISTDASKSCSERPTSVWSV